MFAFLSGRVVDIAEHQLVVDVGGVGYLVHAPRGVIANLSLGSAIEIYIETVVREDAIVLYGFANRDQKKLFNTLTTVQGVGSKIALAFLDAMTPDKIIDAILAGDEAALTEVSGVGRKLAGRIIQELKDKMVKAMDRVGFQPPTNNQGQELVAEVLSAMQKLGFQRSEVYPIVSKILADQSSPPSLENLLQAVLQKINQR